MFKKHKQLIIGFLLGALVFGIVPVGATVQDYLLKKSEAKLMVDGKEFSNKELPVLNYQGYNYVPASTFREICDTIGVGFEWVGEKKEIQIDTKKETVKAIEPKREPQEEDIVTSTSDENIFLVNGVKHISNEGVYDYLRSVNKGKQSKDFYYMGPFEGTDKIYKIGNNGEDIIIDNLPTKRVYGEQFYSNSIKLIEYDFFQNNIIPLLK